MFKKVSISIVVSTLAMLAVSFMNGIPTQAAPSLFDASTLEPNEEESILFIREEEKLARDTYIALYDLWDLQIFSNISESEQSHMDAALTLIDRYNLDDPVIEDLGVFTDPYLQNKYEELVERGTQSEAEALRVGAYIEEMDIVDINERLAQIDNPDIRRVFSNLLDGSENHLRAFVAAYEQLTGESYKPQILDEEALDLILNSESDSGNGPNRFGPGSETGRYGPNQYGEGNGQLGQSETKDEGMGKQYQVKERFGKNR